MKTYDLIIKEITETNKGYDTKIIREYRNITADYLTTLLANRDNNIRTINLLFSQIGKQANDPCIVNHKEYPKKVLSYHANFSKEE